MCLVSMWLGFVNNYWPSIYIYDNFDLVAALLEGQLLINLYDINCRVREEIANVIKDKREICADDLDKLHYMEQVCKVVKFTYYIGLAIPSSIFTPVTPQWIVKIN